MKSIKQTSAPKVSNVTLLGSRTKTLRRNTISNSHLQVGNSYLKVKRNCRMKLSKPGLIS